MKKLKKLVLNQETISNLSNDGMNKLKGGVTTGADPNGDAYDTMSEDIPGYCGKYSEYDNCCSYLVSGTGYGMCCCNATGDCYHN